VHRAEPNEDLSDLAVTVVLARMQLDGKIEYVRRFEAFGPGLERLDQLIEELWVHIQERLPVMIRDFLEACAGGDK
jgi:hypothetical protein